MQVGLSGEKQKTLTCTSVRRWLGAAQGLPLPYLLVMAAGGGPLASGLTALREAARDEGRLWTGTFRLSGFLAGVEKEEVTEEVVDGDWSTRTRFGRWGRFSQRVAELLASGAGVLQPPVLCADAAPANRLPPHLEDHGFSHQPHYSDRERERDREKERACWGGRDGIKVG